MKEYYFKAMKLAHKVHENQFRRNNIPYLIHPLRVSNSFSDYTKKTIAILHDVVEDSNISIDELSAEFPVEITDILVLMTKIEGEEYGDYIKRISKNVVATEIKLADIADNLSDEPSEKQIIKYTLALETLINNL